MDLENLIKFDENITKRKKKNYTSDILTSNDSVSEVLIPEIETKKINLFCSFCFKIFSYNACLTKHKSKCLISQMLFPKKNLLLCLIRKELV